MAERQRPPSQRFEIQSGARVATLTHLLGRVEWLGLAPRARRPIGISVRMGLLVHHSVLLPMLSVVEATEELVRVLLTEEERARLRSAPDGAADADYERVRTGDRAISLDGEVGRLILTLIHAPSRTVSGLVVRFGAEPGIDRIVPFASAGAFRADGISIGLTSADLEDLPEYLEDDAITADVHNVLWYRSDIDPADLQHIEVDTVDGVVHLTGLTRSERARMAIEQTASGVRGVLGVRSRIESGEAIAWANDPDRFLPIPPLPRAGERG